jgi:hypothetical protein
MDTTRYSFDFLRGGILIQEGKTLELGTLGCIATTAPTTTEPHGKVVAITCQHVVSTGKGNIPIITSLASSDSTTITIGQTKNIPIPPQSLVVVAFLDRRNDLIGMAIYTTAQGDTPDLIAKGVADAINTASIPSVSAIQEDPDKPIVKVTGANINKAYFQSDTFGPVQRDPSVRLAAIVETSAGINVVTFQGGLLGNNYGIFVSVHPGGSIATFGTFVNPRHDQTLAGIAESVAKSINDLPPAVRGTIRATASGARVTILDAFAVECLIQGDVKVGQPTNNFAWPCSHQIGRVIDARLDLDAGVIQLDPDLKYKPLIEGIGPVDGFLPTSELSVGFPVQKRGFVSGVSFGEITATGTNGRLGSVFPRYYRNAIIVTSTTKDSVGNLRPFLVAGDSGSALVTAGSSPVKVVGVLFASGDGPQAFAIPMDLVIDAFPALGLSFDLAPGQDPNVVQTVPQRVIAFQGLDSEAEVRATTFGDVAVAIGTRLSEAENEIASTTLGRDYTDLVRRHFAEAQTLLNNNRRVGTVWQRSGGPEIMNRMLEIIYARDQRLPTEINGKPFADCLARIQQILMRYASPAFARDLSRYAPQIAEWSGMTYSELLSAFQNSNME